MQMIYCFVIQVKRTNKEKRVHTTGISVNAAKTNVMRFNPLQAQNKQLLKKYLGTVITSSGGPTKTSEEAYNIQHIITYVGAIVTTFSPSLWKRNLENDQER